MRFPVAYRRFVVYPLIAGIVVVAGVSAAVASSVDKTQHPTDVGMSDAQRNAKYQAGHDQFSVRYAAWVASLNPATIPYGSLPHQELLGLFDPGQPSLAAAKAGSVAIVTGRVRALRLTAFDGTYVTFDVDAGLKGTLGRSVEVHQAGGVRPTQDWKGMFIADAPNAPLLLPGARMTLFLEQRDASRPLEIQSFTGIYRHAPDGIHAVKGNPFLTDVEGLSEGNFIARLAAA